MKWYKLFASGLYYTVINKQLLDGEYFVQIRFKYDIRPFPDLIKLNLLRYHATAVVEKEIPDVDLTWVI